MVTSSFLKLDSEAGPYWLTRANQIEARCGAGKALPDNDTYKCVGVRIPGNHLLSLSHDQAARNLSMACLTKCPANPMTSWPISVSF